MKCAIYKGQKRADTYLYVEHEGDFSRVPDALLELLGPLAHVMTIELTPERALAHAEPTQVHRQLREQGFYLQMPPDTEHVVQ
jgi:uncharacterized protein YcgL (UPF0745 family)